MKKVKILTWIVLLLLVFFLNGEFYQNYLENFYQQQYCFALTQAPNSDVLLETAERCAEKNGYGIFCISKKTDSAFSSSYIIYTNEKGRRLLQDLYDIREGQFSSLLSGTTSVAIESFRMAKEHLDELQENLYVLDGNEAAETLLEEIKQEHSGSGIDPKVRIQAVRGNEWMLTGAWGLVFAFFLLLTWYDIQFQKKEVFVRIFYGSSRTWIVVKNILVDTGGIAVVFGGLYLMLHKSVSLNYKQEIWLPILFGYLFLNMLLYFSLYCQDYKRIMQDASGKGSTLANCYVLKVAVVFTALSLLAVNGKLLKENFDAMEPYQRIEASYQDYVFLDLEGSYFPYDEEIDFTQMLPGEKIEKEKFEACYPKNQVAIASPVFISFQMHYFYVSSNAKNLVKGLDLSEYEGADCNLLIFVPVGCGENPEEAAANACSVVNGLLGLECDITYDVIEYAGQTEVIYFDRDHLNPESLLTGYCLEENPIIIYENIPFRDIFTDDNTTGFNGTVLFDNAMFSLDEDGIRETEENPVFIVESVVEQLKGYHNAVKRVTLLNCILSLCVILLDIFLISAITKMEYQIGARQYSIKKILGYSGWQRYRMNYLLNVLTEGIAVVAVLMVSAMGLAVYDVYDLRYVFLNALILVLLSSFVVNWNLHRLERANVVKILKGGSL